MIQARHNELIKLAIAERDKILGELEEAREKLKQESERIKNLFDIDYTSCIY